MSFIEKKKLKRINYLQLLIVFFVHFYIVSLRDYI